MEAADIVTQPSITEGLGLACIEGMQRGTPAVVNDTAGLGEVVTPGTGHLIDSAEDVPEVPVAEVLHVRPREGFALAVAPAGVGLEDEIALTREHRIVGRSTAREGRIVRVRGAAVDDDDHRVTTAGRVARGIDEPALNVERIALPREIPRAPARLRGRGTAREAELVAGALEDNRRAILLGSKTYGESAIESLIALKSGGAIRLTTARFVTPAGHQIDGKGLAPIGRPMVHTMHLRIPAPQRSAKQLGLLKGKLAVMGPSRMLTFTFDKLNKIEKAADAKKETKEGVTVNLRELRSEGGAGDEVWTVGLLLEYPAGGPKFESFQSWIINNKIDLEKEQGGIKQQFPPNLGYETDDQSDTKAIIRYRFGDEPEKKLILGKFSDWKLVYYTPGRIIEVPVPFEFKELPLP